ncbi:MAG: efflux RND transporter permease subunit [Nitrospirota bacterium]
MIDRLITFALKQRLLILLAVAILIGGGILAFARLPIDAFPDVTNIQVQVITKAPGMSPVEVEQLVTFPLEVDLMGLPKKTELRSISKFGISVITVVFEDGTDIYWARQTVLERFLQAKEKLSPGVESMLGPISTGLGEVYQYRLHGPDYDLTELRTLQDWVVRPLLRTVPGVADVNNLGGFPKEYQVLVDPDRLKNFGLTLRQVFEAVERNNANVGGGFIRHQEEQYVVRGLGMIHTIEDIKNIVVASERGTPIFLRDVAEIRLGSRTRYGGVTSEGKGEAVEGLVLMLMGGNSREIVTNVKAKVEEINRVLPQGVSIVPFYDRTELVNRALWTVEKALLEGAVLVVAVLILFLGNLRSAVIVSLMLPLSVLFTFVLMKGLGLSANLMSLGGLAIGIGMLVDGAVVMVENIYRHLADKQARGGSTLHHILEAAREVGRPVLFGILIIIVVFLPLFSLTGVEGKLFKPLAFTVAFAMLGSLILSLTLVPVLCSLLLAAGVKEREPWPVRKVRERYRRVLDAALARPKALVGGAVALLAGALALFPFIGKEFVPTLDEGDVVINVTRLPSISLDDSLRINGEVERALMQFPEVKTIVTRTGTDEIGVDPMGPELSDIFIILKPEREWTVGTKDELKEKMREAMDRIPGIAYVFSQPIQMRVDEMLAGVRAQIAVKVFGEDMDVLADQAGRIERVLRGIPGAVDVRTEQVSGQYFLEVEADRQALARYGINVADLNEVVETAIGGKVATDVVEGQRRFGVLVRFPEAVRGDVQSVENLAVSAPDGARIPLKQLATIRVAEGPVQINREEGSRRIVIEANVEGRDIASFVAEGQQRIAESVALPPGYYVTWGGQFENQQRAMRRLGIVVPVALFLIFLLLFTAFNKLRHALLILANIPFALIGGIVSLFLFGLYLSVPASVGFIALFGVAILNGVVLVSTFNQLRQEGMALEEAVRIGSERRLRPVLMTALVASLGLVPLLLATGPGSEVQKPLAVVVVGGLITSTALTLLVLPALYRWVEGRREREYGPDGTVPGASEADLPVESEGVAR